AGHDNPLDLVGTFVDLGYFSVAEVALDWEVLEVAIAAEYLDGVGRHAHGDIAGEELGDRRLAGAGEVPAAQVRGAEVEEPRRVDLRRHVRQHHLDRLELADRLAELPPLGGVGDRGFERGAGDANRL